MVSLFLLPLVPLIKSLLPCYFNSNFKGEKERSDCNYGAAGNRLTCNKLFPLTLNEFLIILHLIFLLKLLCGIHTNQF